MNDVRDEALGAVLDREAARIESAPVDRLPEVLRRGGRIRGIRFTAIAAAVAIFAGAVSWVGLQNEGRETIPADIEDWNTFASLQENGWTVQVPPPWHITELPACSIAPERIGVMVTNVRFEFRDPRGGPPDCEDRLVFAGFPPKGVALAFMPRGAFSGLFVFRRPDTALPLTPALLVDSGGIRGGPAESYQSISYHRETLGVIRRFEGPDASSIDVRALDRMLASFDLRGAPRWVEGHARSLGDIRVSFVRPDTWTFAGYPDVLVMDAPTPILRLGSPRNRAESCELPGAPWIRVPRFDDYGVEIVVSDASESFAQPGLGPRPDPITLSDALDQRPVRCRGTPLQAATFGFREAGRPISIYVIATETVFREQPEMLLHILNSIRIEAA